MTLYLYRRGEATPLMILEKVTDYTADSVTTEEGAVYGPFAEDCELSATEDCAGTLRSDWRRDNPGVENVSLDLLADHEERLCMLELTTG